MITNIRWIGPESCSECEDLAVFEVTRTNDELPEHYVQAGVRTINYCATHAPDDVKMFWRKHQFGS